MSVRRMETKEQREFWAGVDKVADEVSRWPRWKIASGLYAIRGEPPTEEELDEIQASSKKPERQKKKTKSMNESSIKDFSRMIDLD